MPRAMLCVLLVLALGSRADNDGSGWWSNGNGNGNDGNGNGDGSGWWSNGNGNGNGNNVRGCRVSVVGAGWGGAYFAYRVSVPSATRIYDAEDVCVFEQNPNRVGGRSYDYGNNLWEDLKVDLGAYRYPNSQEIAKGIAEDILNASVSCYGGPCTDTTGYRMYTDQYGNNGGYATGIRGLLEKFQNKGGRVFYGYKLVNIRKTDQDGRPIKLIFKKGAQTISVKTKKVFLNIHTSAINQLETEGNILYTKSTNYSLAALKAAVDIPTYKQFVWYEDAWWVTKLNKTVGSFSAWGALPAVNDGRYHDGAVKCYKLKPNGQRQYFPQRVTGGVDGSKCYGALHVAYVSFDDTSYNYFYNNWVTAEEKAAGKVAIFIKQGDERQAFLQLIHNSIMNAVAGDLAAAGINASSIALPTSVVTGLWNSPHNPENPSYFVNIIDSQSGLPTPDAQYSLNNLAAKPLKNFDVFVGSEAYGISFGWAEGSLLMVERVLAAYFDMSRPSYVSNLYWNQFVLPYLPHVKNCNVNADCPSTNNCVQGTCHFGKCIWASKTNQACSQDDLCNLNTVCSYSGMCYGPDKVCPPSTPVCVGGQCVADTAPSMPACHYSNSFGPFNLWWEFIGTDEIRFVYQMPGNSYTAFGIGSNMTNADIIGSFTQGDGQRYVRDYWTFSAGQPSLDSDLGGTNDLTNIFIASDGWGQPSKTWFTRKLNTGDSKDKVIVNGVNSFIYAYGEEGIAGQFQYHGPNRNSFTLDLSVCTV